MNQVIEVRVIQDDKSLSKVAYTYTVDPLIDLRDVEEVSVPMRGKPVRCKIVNVLHGEKAEAALDNLNYPKDKVVHLNNKQTTVELTAVSKEDVDGEFSKFLKS